MKSRRDIALLVAGVAALSAVILFVGFYVRDGGKEILLVTALSAVPAAGVVTATSYALRKASIQIQLTWCIAMIILLRSIMMWLPGVNFRDETRLIDSTTTYFHSGVATGYLVDFPVNILFVGIFYGIYTHVWPNLESYELLAFFVYPLLVLTYYFMAEEVSKLKSTLFKPPNPLIPAVMFLPFAPVFQIIPTYYWPQLLGLTVLCFCFASILHLLSATSRVAEWSVITMGSALVVVFVHNITSALLLLTIFFFLITVQDWRKRRSLFVVGIITFVAFMAAHLDQYSWLVRNTIMAVLGSGQATQGLRRLSFTSLSSIITKGPIATIASTGFFLVVGILILADASGAARAGSRKLEKLHLSDYFKKLINGLIKDPLTFSFAGFTFLALVSGLFLQGLFDPVRLIGWGSLLILPRVIPSKKRNALMFLLILLALFFLLVWVINSPWGSPFYSNPNLSPPAGS